MKHKAPLLLALLLLLFFGRPSYAQQEQVGAHSADYVLIIDNSGSMLDNDPDVLRIPAARLFIDLANDNDRIGIVAMSTADRTGMLTDGLVSLDALENRSQIKNGLKQTIAATEETFYGGTYIGNAITLAQRMLSEAPNREGRPQYVILLTDGLPDPPEQADVAAQAIASQTDIPMFTIALGEDADRDWLGEAIAYPTGGLVFRASTAKELISVYLQISSYLFDNRYINEVTMTNGDYDGTLFTVIPEQRITSLTFVVERPNGLPVTQQLMTPGNVDLLKVSRGAFGIFRSEEPSYELFTVSLGTSLPMEGAWRLIGDTNLLRQTPVTVYVLAQSEWRTRMTLPIPSVKDRDQSVRFVPAARESLLQVGMLNTQGKWASQMGPSIQVLDEIWLEAAPNQLISANDAEKSLYSVENRIRLENGSFKDSEAFQFRVEIPIRSQIPIQLQREYPIEVMPLPILTMSIDRETSADLPMRLDANQPFSGTLTIDLARGDMQPKSIEHLDLFVAEPGEPFRPISYTQRSANEVIFSHIPQFGHNGRYELRAIAHLVASDGSRDIRYSDFTSAAVDVTVLPTVVIQPVESSTDSLLLPTNSSEQIEFILQTNTWRDETLYLDYQVAGGSVLSFDPDEFVLAAGEREQRVTVNVISQRETASTDDLNIVFRSASDTIRVRQDPHTWQVKIADFLQVAPQNRESVVPLDNEEGVVTVRIRSRSAESQVLEVTPQSIQLSGVVVKPARISVPPNTETNYTFRVGGDLDTAVTSGKVALRFSAESDDLIILNNEAQWDIMTHQESTPWIQIILLTVILFCACYWIYLRRQENKVQFKY